MKDVLLLNQCLLRIFHRKWNKKPNPNCRNSHNLESPTSSLSSLTYLGPTKLVTLRFYSVILILLWWLTTNNERCSPCFTCSYSLQAAVLLCTHSRYLLRFFDCLAHPNLSATFATDQKWPLSHLRISYQSLAECH